MVACYSRPVVVRLAPILAGASCRHHHKRTRAAMEGHIMHQALASMPVAIRCLVHHLASSTAIIKVTLKLDVCFGPCSRAGIRCLFQLHQMIFHRAANPVLCPSEHMLIQMVRPIFQAMQNPDACPVRITAMGCNEASLACSQQATLVEQPVKVLMDCGICPFACII